MKKIFLILTMALILVTSGCQKEEVTKIKQSELESYVVDMSGYKNMSSVNHNFKGVTPETLLKAIDNKESGIFYMGYDGCHVCQNVVSLIDEAAKNLNLSVYYIDCYNELAPLEDYIYEVVDKLKPILNKDSSGEYGIFTPHVFVMIDGEFKESYIGLDDYDGSDKSKQKEIEHYQEMMKYFE